jgi:hypothetical protein
MDAGGDAEEDWNSPSCLDHVFHRRTKPDLRLSVRPPIRWQHLEDVLRALGQDQPVQVTALADDVQGLSSPLIGHLVVPEITERHAEYSTPFSGSRRFTIPAVWGAASFPLVQRRRPTLHGHTAHLPALRHNSGHTQD